MFSNVFSTLIAYLLLSCNSSDARFVAIPGYEGFILPARVQAPKGVSDFEKVEHVFVFIHGSGPLDMAMDLKDLTEKKTSNPVFKDIADDLGNRGFASVRYHKRSFVVQKRMLSDPEYKDSKEYQDFTLNALKYYIEDAKAAAAFAKSKFPNAKVYYFGVSQGTYVALQAIDELPIVSGAVLVGYTNSSLTTSIFEQTVYRPLDIFKRIDLNHDQKLDATEFAKPGKSQESLKSQMPVIDLNKDGLISQSEFMGGNLTNQLLTFPSDIDAYTVEEATRKKSAEILSKTDKRILFLQGEWDNQTPSYHAKSIQLLSQSVWKKDNYGFIFFEKRGHILDKRKSYDDLVFTRLDQEIKDQIAATIQKFLIDGQALEPTINPTVKPAPVAAEGPTEISAETIGKLGAAKSIENTDSAPFAVSPKKKSPDTDESEKKK